MKVGAAKVVITPPLGVELVGYGPRLARRSLAIHQDLSAQAVVFEDGGQQAALVSCDLLALTARFVSTVRAMVEASTGIAADRVMVSCTHSHTAPSTGDTREWGQADHDYVRLTARAVAGAVAWAQRRLVPATLRVGRTKHPGLAWNRTGRGKPDETLHTVHAVGESGEVVAIIAQFACHPVVLGPKTVISPDFPGVMRRALEVDHPGCVALFLNGACGDVDPVSNRDAWGQGSLADVERFGLELADSVKEAMAQAVPLAGSDLGVARSELRLSFDLPSAREVSEQIRRFAAEARGRGGGGDDGFGAPASGEVAMPGFWLRYYRALQRRMLRGQADHETVELQGLRLGDDLALVAIPAEVYAEHGREIQAGSPFAHTILVCYANGCCGYLPPTAEFERASYTAKLAAAVYDRPPFRAGVADELVAATGELLGRVASTRVAGRRVAGRRVGGESS